ncbi:phage gp6-like head-tail connector protein [Kribbella solani]|uniref:head-tail connector protein n=1 Tax=Kribbella solani TaxID=236067 RepID=UPI0029BDCF1B|nr:head-tail connector protein [Kribbella solani]MDX3006735.1 phage gp6-like head-tail connector protein [Kribbella solani]
MGWAPDYVTATDLKAYLKITDALDDAQIALAVTAASRAVDRYTNRQFGQLAAVEARKYTAQWDTSRCKWVVCIDDLMTTAGLIVATAAAITDYSLRPTNADLKGEPWTHIVLNTGGTGTEDAVTVTARYGWTVIPVAVQQATLLQASRLFTRKDSPYGVAGSPDLGSEMRLLAQVDPDVKVALGPYVRWWAAA